MGARTPEPDDEHDPTSDADDVDARFAEITASLGDLTVPPGDLREGASEEAATPQAEPPLPAPAAPGPRDYELAASDDDEGYEPPEPAPLTGGDPLVALGWIGVLTPVVLVLVYLMLWRGMPTALLALAGVVFVLAIGVLLWRMPSRRAPDEDDNGAVL